MNNNTPSPTSRSPVGFPASLLLVLALLFLHSLTAHGSNVQFVWQANTESDLAGYRLYCQDLNEPHPTVNAVGKVTTCTATDLVPGRTYDFYLTAYNLAGLESDPSTVVRIAVPPDDSTTPNPDTQNLMIMLSDNHAHKVNRGGHSWTSVNANGTLAQRALPDTGTIATSDYASSSPYIRFSVNFTSTGTHYVWLRGLCTGGDNTAHVGLNGRTVATAENIRLPVTGDWVWAGTTGAGQRATVNVTQTGWQTIEVYMREDGFTFERIAFSTSAAFAPSGAMVVDEDPYADRLPPTEVRLASDGPQLTWTAIEGVLYQIQYKDDLSEASWKVMVTLLAANTRQVYRDYTRGPDNRPLARSHPGRFYRVVEMR